MLPVVAARALKSATANKEYLKSVEGNVVVRVVVVAVLALILGVVPGYFWGYLCGEREQARIEFDNRLLTLSNDIIVLDSIENSGMQASVRELLNPLH